jgi:F-type H+-transporting ATPase subunit delta
MKIGKEAQRTARKLFEASLVGGKVDLGVVQKIVGRLSSTRPRGFLPVVTAFFRLVKLELAKSEAVVESATPLDPAMQRSVLADLRAKYGNQIEAVFKINPELIGGMRIRVGSDVWDGSVKNRIERLANKFC